MHHIFYLLLRRLRTPIILLITVYGISMAGLTLIPGQDDQGQVWHMDFFHAFYFVSFMGTTIGFGEIPYAFTPSQRLWVTFTLYATVLAWLYSIGTIFSLLQQPNVKRLLKSNRFGGRVNRISHPFYIVCGYGVTGKRIVNQLATHGIQTVVIDLSSNIIDELEADELSLSIPYLCEDAANPSVLDLAGISKDLCIGVLALTIDDHANLAIAINSKLVKPKRLVISRAQSKSTAANLESFGTDLIIDPFETFADHMVLILQEPYKHILHNLIVNPKHNVWMTPHQNTKGRWVVCGYRRMGKALHAMFNQYNIPVTFIEIDIDRHDAPKGTIYGTGAEAKTLFEAGIENAVGIIAGTPDDADNLSIIITAREINPNLVTIARQNKRANKPVFKAAEVNIIMESGRIIANEIYMLLRTPLLSDFFRLVREQDETWTRDLIVRISDYIKHSEIDAWTISINSEECIAAYDAIVGDFPIKISHLYDDPHNRDTVLPAIPLLIKRGKTISLLPQAAILLKVGDQILFCGEKSTQDTMRWATNNHNVMRYIKTGRIEPDGLVWRWLHERRRQHKEKT
jgi:voltage-gated potassium channel